MRRNPTKKATEAYEVNDLKGLRLALLKVDLERGGQICRQDVSVLDNEDESGRQLEGMVNVLAKFIHVIGEVAQRYTAGGIEYLNVTHAAMR